VTGRLCLVDQDEWDEHERALVASRAAWVREVRPDDPLLYTLAFLHPDLAVEFDDERNEISAYDVRPHHAARVWWRCWRDVRHRWATAVSNRTVLGTRCPYCRKRNMSQRELQLYRALAVVLPGLEHGGRLPRTDRAAGGNRHRHWHVDMLLPGSPPVVVEYDGTYWHREATVRDAQKSADLVAGGAVVVRVREHPLESVGPDGVLCRPDEPVDELARRVMLAIADATGRAGADG
jgi:hypothetical protein